MKHAWCLLPMVLTLACSGGSAGEGGGSGFQQKQNKDPDGAYGFDGPGWSQSENVEGQDIWAGPNGLMLVIEIESDLGYSSAEDWAKEAYASTEQTGASMSFEPEALGNGSWWWGWYFGGDVFESYVLTGSRGVNPALQPEETLAKEEAAAILSTFALGP
jgi:hypothetical protein